ncbi:hypothetical protein WJX81_006753 [Elliptochloris bilobata]|uniref:Uncharacterized protein n=1 Tax=Elliptochloris bilobata TaxID=381761 RepID=A0AAW1RA32_9CHLO
MSPDEAKYEAALDKAVVTRQNGGGAFIRAVRSPELYSEVALTRPDSGLFMDARDPFSEGPGARVQHAADAQSRAISPEPFRVAARARDVFDAAIPLPVYCNVVPHVAS